MSSTMSKDESSPHYTVHTFPPTPFCYNICPFDIKLESFLRINKIPYTNCYTSKFSKKGTIPYLAIGDEQVSDSNMIITRLQQLHPTTTQSTLTPAQRAITRSMIIMLEEHTAQIGFHYRYALHMTEFCASIDLDDRLFHADLSRKGSFIVSAWKRFQPKATQKKSKARGLDRHDLDELWRLSFDDLDALQDLLGGDDTYFFGRASPSLLDCAVFGHLVQFLYIPIDFPQKAHLKDNCPKLVAFVERFKGAHWSDWEDMCRRQPNERFLEGRNNKSSGSTSKNWIVAAVLGAAILAGYKYLM